MYNLIIACLTYELYHIRLRITKFRLRFLSGRLGLRNKQRKGNTKWLPTEMTPATENENTRGRGMPTTTAGGHGSVEVLPT